MTLFYKKIGSGPDLVLLHGFAFNSEIWSKIESSLAGFYTLHLIDLPGCGQSQSVRFSSDIKSVVSQLVTYLPESAHYVGWSLGGLLALQIALSFPERVKSVMTVASTPCFIEQENWLGVSSDFFDQFRVGINNNLQKTLRQFVARMLKDVSNRQAHISALINLIGECDIESLNHMLDVLETTDLRDSLLSITVPYRILQDSHDPLSPHNDATAMTVAGMGHLPMWIEPDRFVQQVKDFAQ